MMDALKEKTLRMKMMHLMHLETMKIFLLGVKGRLIGVDRAIACLCQDKEKI